MRLGAGDILMTRAPDPCGTLVFPLVVTLVLDVGGQLSHGAIAAREYGIPAMVNVPDATHRIREGQMAVVACTTGRDGELLDLDGVTWGSIKYGGLAGEGHGR